jgi:hypothetical protein
LDEQFNIKSLPPILIKKYKTFFGMPKNRFLHQLMHDYFKEEYLVIRIYSDNGKEIAEKGWGVNG